MGGRRVLPPGGAFFDGGPWPCAARPDRARGAPRALGRPTARRQGVDPPPGQNTSGAKGGCKKKRPPSKQTPPDAKKRHQRGAKTRPSHRQCELRLMAAEPSRRNKVPVPPRGRPLCQRPSQRKVSCKRCQRNNPRPLPSRLPRCHSPTYSTSMPARNAVPRPWRFPWRYSPSYSVSLRPFTHTPLPCGLLSASTSPVYCPRGAQPGGKGSS